jgi:pantoate--beta-alanine ligase
MSCAGVPCPPALLTPQLTVCRPAVQYLDEAQRAAAPCLYRALEAAAVAHSAARRSGGQRADADLLRQAVEAVLRTEPLFEEIDYISVASVDDFTELSSVSSEGAVLSVAVKIGQTRLLDNVLLAD